MTYFFSIWQDQILDKNLPIEIKKMLSVWEFPVSNKYTKVYKQTNQNTKKYIRLYLGLEIFEFYWTTKVTRGGFSHG